jgi:hypothetical protein
MASWTTHELRRLDASYIVLDKAALLELLPRHSMRSIYTTAQHRGLCRKRQLKFIAWLRLAHDHYARRDQQFKKHADDKKQEAAENAPSDVLCVPGQSQTAEQG